MTPTPESNKPRPTDIRAITITRTESFDPLRVIEEATAQARAERIVTEHADPADPAALSYRFEKDEQEEGLFIDLVIEGEDKHRLRIVLARLNAGNCELSVSYHG